MPITRTYYKVHRCFPDPDYFYVENISGSASTFEVIKSGTPASTDLAYSLDKVTWTDIHNGGTISNVANGAKVYFRSSTGFSNNTNNMYFIRGLSNFNAGGHIATLLNYLNVEGVTSIPSYAFNNMFYKSGYGMKLVHANIDFYGIKTIGDYGCNRMFFENRQLIEIPDFSGIESVGMGALTETFYLCTSLMTPANLSNVTSWNNGSITGIYGNCSSLTEAIAPNVLSWTTTNASNWLSGVAATGVVRKPAGLTITADSASGVPSGWTTEDY